MSDLPARLRRAFAAWGLRSLGDEAADRIDALTAENAELKADLDAATAWLRDIYRTAPAKETGAEGLDERRRAPAPVRGGGVMTTDLQPGQIWFPEPGKRAKAREIVRLGERHGTPHVFWSPFWRDCGHTGISPIRVDGFRNWIRKHGATIQPAPVREEG